MAKFEIKSDKKNVHVYLKFSGEIDEDANFAGAEISGADEIDVDFQEINSINSCGVRELYKWVESIPTRIKVNYLFCHEIIIGQFNMVAGLLKANIKVKSFYTPYFCEVCNVRTEVLFSAGTDFNGANVRELQDVKCHKCSGPTAIDVIENSYFKFLQWQG